MVYVQHNWQAGRDGGTPITAVALNEMEDGIDLAINQGLVVGSVTTGAVADAAITGDPGSKQLDLVLPESTDYGWLHAAHNGNGGTPYEALFLHYSPDGRTALGGYGNPVYRPVSTGTSLRDPHIKRIGETWFMVYTPNNGQSKTFEVAKSDDLINWTLVTTVDTSGVSGMEWSWAPELVQETNGDWYVFFTAVDTGPVPATHQIWRMKATDNTTLAGFNGLTQVVWSASPGDNPIDPGFFRSGSLWYIFYGVEGVIHRATAPTLTSTWTIDRTGDWAGWVANATDGANHRGYEGPELELVEPGRIRLYLDRYLVDPLNYAAGCIYTESTDDMATWSVPVVVKKGPGFPVDGQVRHGTWLKIATALEHEQVLGATLGTAGKIFHAEYTGTGTITAGNKWLGPFTLDTAKSKNTQDFLTTSGRQITIQRTGVYSVDFFVSAATALGGWIAVKGPVETPNYITNDIAAGAPAWSISAANLWLEAGTVLEFYFNAGNTITLTGLRVRITKVV
jgi:hypothetical protein